MMRQFILILGALLCASLNCLAGTPRIAFYFIQTEGKALSDLRLDDQPFLTDADILTYSWTNHTMAIESNAISRLPDMKQVGTGGKAFAVVVDGERRYRGAFWGSYSSISHFNPVILVDHYDPANITIYRMYPTVDLSGKVDVVVDGRKTSVSDPREDDALKRVLTAIGKLKQTKAPNKASDATSEPAPGAASSSHQR
jgi:hypothetical protein